MESIRDYEMAAKDKLTQSAYDYYRSGANGMVSLADNERAYHRLYLKTSAQVDSRQFQGLKTQVMGFELDSPICIASTAFHKMATLQGEVATAKAANNSKTGLMLSSWSTTPLEEVADQCPDVLKMFQVYMSKVPGVNEDLWSRVRNSGYKIMALTTDTQQLGKREIDVRNSFQLPQGMQLANMTKYLQQGDSADLKSTKESGLSEYVKNHKNNEIGWDIINFVKQESQLKVVAKGIMCYDDAVLALKNGADGLFVSNHGARQLDTTPATIDCLPEVVRARNDFKVNVPIFFDGGIRRGSDVLKAIALGADVVFIGRAVLWGLACEGQQGVEKVIKILNQELKHAMLVTGCMSIQDIKDKGQNLFYSNFDHIFKL